jgi:hypothetical protein
MLAGVSTDYYVRLEKGRLSHVSEGVLNAVADALQLDEAERVHLFDLVGALRATGDERERQIEVPVGVRWLLDCLTSAPAFVADACLDVIAINELGKAFYSPMFDGGVEQPNFARFGFLDPRARSLYPDWNGAANVAVAQLRMATGRDPLDRRLSHLVKELSASSEEFRIRWSLHDVRLHRSGFKQFAHPVAGAIEVAYISLELPTDARLVLTVYTVEPGSPSDQAMEVLRRWAPQRTAMPGTRYPDPRPV